MSRDNSNGFSFENKPSRKTPSNQPTGQQTGGGVSTLSSPYATDREEVPEWLGGEKKRELPTLLKISLVLGALTLIFTMATIVVVAIQAIPPELSLNPIELVGWIIEYLSDQIISRLEASFSV